MVDRDGKQTIIQNIAACTCVVCVVCVVGGQLLGAGPNVCIILHTVVCNQTCWCIYCCM